MSQSHENQCTQLVFYDGPAPSQKEIAEALEKGNVETKIENMKKVIMLHLNGEPQSSLVMTVIRFVLPSDDHTLKKLLLYFFEIIDKTNAQGNLLPEMILVCNFIRNDLQHPNEYIRGCTLRFICKLKEEELVEPLTDSIVQNLEHRHSYVRRNAVMAVFSVHTRFPRLIPDAPEIIENYLENEADVSAKRNAFLMLFNCAQDRAVRYLRKAIDADISASGDVFQLALVDLLKSLCKTNPQEKPRYLRVIFSLLTTKSPSVLFQCATTLLSLSTSPTAIRESATTFVNLLNTHGDNNVKLIVLDRLEEIKKSFPEILAELLMDLLRTLSSPNMDIRRKILDLCLTLVSERNVEKVVQFLKKEVVKAQAETDGDRQANQEYRQMLVRSIHQCTVKHPSVAHLILPVLSDYIVENSPSAVDVVLFIREIVQKQPALREEVLAKLVSLFTTIASPRVLRIALWIFGVQCRTPEEIQRAILLIKQSLGPFPLVPIEKTSHVVLSSKSQGADHGDGSSSIGDIADNGRAGAGTTTAATTTRIAVREDGSYVTVLQSATPVTPTSPSGSNHFATFLLTGDFFLASVLCSTLTKLVLEYHSQSVTSHEKTKLRMEVMEILSELLKMGQNSNPVIDDDSLERILLCQHILHNVSSPIARALYQESFTAFQDLLKGAASKEAEQAEKAQAAKLVTLVDCPLHFTQLSRGRNRTEEDIEAVEDVQLAISNQSLTRKSDFVSRLSRVLQLTGFSDPVYAEATVTVHQFDILLDLLIVNQTKDTMQNLTVELATVGDLKLCERPQSYTLAGNEQLTIKANIKVSSTETGVIFGNIVYDLTSSYSERNCVILNDIHIDIMDYISPATCPAAQFRTMWAEFEWENKVAVSTEIRSLREYLDHILKNTNMRCITADSSLEGDCDFLSANLYAKSSFGEDALANISIERHPDGKIEGFLRIRSKTQGIALSLGDKITMKQKG
eukprot:RCo037862